MADSFSACLQFVLSQEGGYSNDPRDAGGETNFGISKRAFPELDIKNLTRDQAAEIYRSHYWEPTHCDALEPPVALMVFDAAVNSGINRAIRFLQNAVNAKVDGMFGPQTIEKVAEARPQDVVQNYHAVRAAFYLTLSTFPRFGQGWLKRNDACRDLALSWIPPGDTSNAT